MHDGRLCCLTLCLGLCVTLDVAARFIDSASSSDCSWGTPGAVRKTGPGEEQEAYSRSCQVFDLTSWPIRVIAPLSGRTRRHTSLPLYFTEALLSASSTFSGDPTAKLARVSNNAPIMRVGNMVDVRDFRDSSEIPCVPHRQAAWGVHAPETAVKEVWASDDGGVSWQHVGSPAPLQWPSIFQCASGRQSQHESGLQSRVFHLVFKQVFTMIWSLTSNKRTMKMPPIATVTTCHQKSDRTK